MKDNGQIVTKKNIKGLSRTRLAREAEVGVETIRYYEQRGLIDEPSKPEHAHPLYSSRALDQLKFIKRAQSAGFTLKEIATLNSLGSDHCSVTRALAQEKLEAIQTQITEFQSKVVMLQDLIEKCNQSDAQGKCGLFENLLDQQCK